MEAGAGGMLARMVKGPGAELTCLKYKFPVSLDFPSLLAASSGAGGVGDAYDGGLSIGGGEDDGGGGDKRRMKKKATTMMM
eukprot:3933241-Rhodomonas_salina.1